MSFVGQRFGRLTVIGPSSRKGYVTCKCDCGNTHDVRSHNLKNTYSCGCYKKELARINWANVGRRNLARRIEVNKRYDTNIYSIMSNKLPRNNTSGCRGVYFDASRGKYRAVIALHKKRHYLGDYAELKDAIKARKRAEEQMYSPIIEAAKEDFEMRKAVAL